MRLTRCDNCGKEETDAREWFTLVKYIAPAAAGGFLIGGATNEFDLCSPKCIEEKAREFYATDSRLGRQVES